MIESPIEYRKKHRMSDLDNPIIFDRGFINIIARKVHDSVIIILKLQTDDKTDLSKI